ncbi:phosphatidylinositol N-acetylglucosaminyltransferase subunit H-like [Schistocerca gregaria]|uniref:phosphatidylinositol N-acetylglucosaminyltransferase subunit H-like n=1 Tax=Schistocerca gregaria TaxID=7010 RepID=UPI00211F2650|nr:phosphatidylinositol N-acetylglucosaminyltransferase subunit H-like [Schistocerca gregaria]
MLGKEHQIIFIREKRNIYGRKLRLSVIQHTATDLCFEYILSDLSGASKNQVLLTTVIVLVLLTECHFHLDICFVVALWLALISLIFNLLWSVTSEALLAVGSFGLQLTTTYRCGHETTHFIPWCAVGDIVINEAITLQRVIFYLAILPKPLKDSEVSEIIPLFQNTRPPLELLEFIYKSIQKIISDS